MNGATRLVLIKHALPEIVPDVNSHEWRLSQMGREQCRPLAAALSEYAVDLIATSTEPKARETGEIVALLLGVDYETAEDLHENDRTGFPFLERDAWRAAFVEFFQRPDTMHIGRETAHQAEERFALAIDRVMDGNTAKTVAVVTHGTVLSLFVARFNAIDPFELWEQLTCPSFVVLTWPEYRLLRIVPQVGS